jgi:hypothetical protein
MGLGGKRNIISSNVWATRGGRMCDATGINEITIHLARNYGWVEWHDVNYGLSAFEYTNDDPSRIFADGSFEYHHNNLFERDDGPACIYSDGTKVYYYQGRLTKKVKHGGRYCCIGIDDPCEAYLGPV